MCGKCKDCKHFKRYTGDRTWRPTTYGECDCNKFVYIGFSDKKERKYKENDLLGYSDYEAYSAYFEVGEEFGCIHFEKGE